MNVYVCIILMSAVTYAIRFFPLVILRKKITNTFLVSFLHYVPYVTLSVMIFPAILDCTSDIRSAVAGFASALALSLLGCNLIVTVGAGCLAVFLVQLIL